MKNLLVHYDCDPGQDDAIALLFAMGAGVQFSSISVVGGNVDVNQCATNMLQLLELTGKTDIPVYVGAPQPLKRMSMPLPDVFGVSGMDGANLPTPITKPAGYDAVDYMLKAKLPDVLVATGPLTNLALCIQKDPSFPKRFKHLILMGGCTRPEYIHGRMGNIQPKGSDDWAEYNFAVDPEAAQIVLSAGFEKITLIGLDITRTVLYSGTIDERLRTSNTKISTVAANILSTVGAEDKVDYLSRHAFKDDPVRGMHDVVAMAYLTDPDIFATETLPLRIIIDPPPASAGQSVIDAEKPDHPNVTVVTDLDRAAFLDKLVNYLEALG